MNCAKQAQAVLVDDGSESTPGHPGIFGGVGEQTWTPYYQRLSSTGYISPIYVSASPEFLEGLELLNDNDLDDILQDLEDAKSNEEECKNQQHSTGVAGADLEARPLAELYQLFCDELHSLTDLINEHRVDKNLQGLSLNESKFDKGKLTI